MKAQQRTTRKLNELPKRIPRIESVIPGKQKLIQYVLLKTLPKRRMARKLPGFLKLLDQLQQSPIKVTGQYNEVMVRTHISMWRFSKSNGITEGFHTKWKCYPDELTDSETLRTTE